MLVHEAYSTALEQKRGMRKLERGNEREGERAKREADECHRTSSNAKARVSFSLFLLLGPWVRAPFVPRPRGNTRVLSRAFGRQPPGEKSLDTEA